MMDIYLEGDWEEADRILTGLPVKLKRAAHRGLADEARLLRLRVQRNIRAQRYPHVPLSPMTVRKKGHDTILIHKGDMVDAIDDFRMSDGRWGVGIQHNEKEAAKLAAHEYGTTKTPARPTLRVEMERMRSGGLKDLRSSLRSVLMYGY